MKKGEFHGDLIGNELALVKQGEGEEAFSLSPTKKEGVVEPGSAPVKH